MDQFNIETQGFTCIQNYEKNNLSCTFDPIHNGHIDIAKKASKLFDHLVFVIAENADKKPF